MNKSSFLQGASLKGPAFGKPLKRSPLKNRKIIIIFWAIFLLGERTQNGLGAFWAAAKCAKPVKPEEGCRTAAERAAKRAIEASPSPSEGERSKRHQRSPLEPTFRRRKRAVEGSGFQVKGTQIEGFEDLVESQPTVSRKFGCRLFWGIFYKYFVFLTFWFFFLLKKQKIKGFKKQKINSFLGARAAGGGGDFDVFASCPASNPPRNFVSVKKQPFSVFPPTRSLNKSITPLNKIHIDNICKVV
ncbi:hypothetical protein GF382_00780 [Candidatus Falkowbacteria bacterium]|nr:hypothetical protein [Candidatus Falkowbacteria bacterium]